MGVAGAGKTTVARRLAQRCGYVFADADDFHAPANLAQLAAGVALDDADRAPWLERLAAWQRDEHAEGRSTVLACSALKRRYRERLAVGESQPTFVHLIVPEAVLSQRLQRRAHFMAPSLLGSQLADLEPLAAEERGFAVDATLDIDAIVSEIASRIR